VHRSLEPLLAQGVEVRVPVLPASEDPDSFVKKNPPEALQALFAASEDLTSFLIRDNGKPIEALSPEEKDALIKSALAILQHNPSAEVREEHAQNLRKKLGMRPAPIRMVSTRSTIASQILSGAPSRVPNLFVSGSSLSVRDDAVPEWQLLQLLLSYPDIVRAPAESLDLSWFADERARDLVDHALALLAEKNALSLRELMDRIPESLQDALMAIEVSEQDEPDRVRQSLKDYALAVELRHLRRELTGATSPESHMEIHKRIRELNARKTP